MKKRKIVASAIVLTMAMSGLAACSGKKNDEFPRTITSDVDWYNVTELKLAGQYSEADYDYLYTSFIGAVDDGYITVTNGQIHVPEDANWETINYLDYDKYYLDYYDLDGELINSVSLGDLVEGDNTYINNQTLDGDEVVVTFYSYDDRTWEETNYEVRVNYRTGETSDFVEVEGSANSDYNMWDRHPETSYEGAMEVGDELVHKFWIDNDDSYSYIVIYVDADGNETEWDLRDEMSDLSIFDISRAIKASDTKILLMASGSGSDGALYFEIDTENLTITDVTDDYSWIEDVDLYSLTSIEGVGSFAYDYNAGLRMLDFDNQTADIVIGFDNCNINREKLSNLSVIAATEDSVSMAGTVYSNSMMGGNDFEVITFTRADSNPNVGKTIIRVASLDTYSYAIYESICQFNETSDTCFMITDDRYNTTNVDWEDDWTWEDWQNAMRQSAATLGDQLTVDLIAGVGPDILLNASNLTQLNNADYLVDIMGDVNNSDDYFTNIFEACTTDGALYQLPLSISTVGISTYAEFVDDDQIGFTFDEYLEFVDEVCNGTDPISLSKSEYFEICHAAMLDMFRDGNTVNYDSDAFRALADYIKNDVVESSFDYKEDDWGVWEEGGCELPNASYGAFSSISSFFSQYNDRVGDVRFLGVPTYDGRGPQFQITSSVAISAQSANIDACREYLNILLSDDLQALIASTGWDTPVNRAVLIDAGEMAVEAHNKEVDEYSRYFTQEELIMYGLSSAYLDNSAVDYYVDIIESCTTCATVDASVSLIINEEMQAYYEGQKDIDTVIDTMSNRITTYLNERG